MASNLFTRLGTVQALPSNPPSWFFFLSTQFHTGHTDLIQHLLIVQRQAATLLTALFWIPARFGRAEREIRELWDPVGLLLTCYLQLSPRYLMLVQAVNLITDWSLPVLWIGLTYPKKNQNVHKEALMLHESRSQRRCWSVQTQALEERGHLWSFTTSPSIKTQLERPTKWKALAFQE